MHRAVSEAAQSRQQVQAGRVIWHALCINRVLNPQRNHLSQSSYHRSTCTSEPNVRTFCARRAAMLNMALTMRMQTRLTPALLNLTRLLTLPTMSLQQAVQQELIENPALIEVEARCPTCGASISWICPRCIGGDNRGP